MPVGVQRSTICPSRHRVSLRLVALAMEIIDSMGLPVVRVLGEAVVDARRATVDICSSPSRRDAAARGTCSPFRGKAFGITQPRCRGRGVSTP